MDLQRQVALREVRTSSVVSETNVTDGVQIV